MLRILTGKNKKFAWSFCKSKREEERPGSHLKIIPNHLGAVKTIKKAGHAKAKMDGVLLNFNETVVMKTADCIPAIVWWPNTEWRGVLHLGYKGLLANVVKNFAKESAKSGLSMEKVRIIFGPHICPDCYTHQTLKRRLKWLCLKLKFPSQTRSKTGILTFNLSGAYIEELLKFGVVKKNIEVIEQCTNCKHKLSRHYKNKDKNIVTILSRSSDSPRN